jgi:hypothetical protein
MKPYWTHPDGMTSWYRVHILERNYSVKIVESPFDEMTITEIKFEWSGGNSFPRQVPPGDEYDKVCAAVFAAKKATSDKPA